MAAIVLSLALGGLTQAATLTFDANPAITGAQDGDSVHWNAFATTFWNGSGNVTWPDSHLDEAIFGAGNGAAGTVFVGDVTANKITFNAPGSGAYILTNTNIAMAGATPTITTNVDATIASRVVGTAGLTKAGSGTLVLIHSANTYLGGTSISAGTLQIGNGMTNGAPNGTYAISGGATLRLSYNSDGAVTPAWANFTGAGTLALKTLKNFDFGWGTLALPAGFTGKLLIEGGRPNLNNGGVGLGGATAVEVKQGGHLGMWTGGTHTANFIVAGTGYGEEGYEGALRFGNGGFTTTLNGSFTLAGDTTLGASGGTGIITQAITEMTPGTNLRFGSTFMAGTVEVRGANTYSGTTTVSDGTLRLAHRDALQYSTLTTGDVIFSNAVASNSFVFGGLSGSGVFNLVNTDLVAVSLTVGNNNAHTTHSGFLSGPGSLIKIGTGRTQLTGVTNYTGATTVNNGTLQVPTGATTTGACTVADNATLAVAGSPTQSFRCTSLTVGSTTGATLEFPALSSLTTAPILATTALTTHGDVVLKFSGPFSTGNFPLIKYPAAGTIGGAGFAAFELAPLPFGVAANLLHDNATGTISLNVTSAALIWKGSPSSAWDIGTSTAWTLNGSPSVFQNGASTMFDDSATGSTNVAISGAVAPLSVTVNNSTKDYTFSGSGSISGSAVLIKSGSGILTLINANTYAGLTTVSGGTLKIGDGTTDGSISGPMMNNASVVFHSTGTTSYGGDLSGGASASITKQGPGTVTLTGANSFGGITSVSAGTLRLGNGSTNANFSAGTYTVGASGRILIDNASAVSANIWAPKLSGAGVVELNSAQAVNGSANWGPDSPIPTPFPAGFTGTLQVTRGRIDLSPAGAGGMTKLVIKDGAQFLAWDGNYAGTLAAEIAGNGWGEAGQPGALRVAGESTVTWAGPISLTANAGIYSQADDSACTLAGPITGPHECHFISNGSITVAPSLPVRNSYGSTRISSPSGFGIVGAGNAFAFSPGALVVDDGILALNGFSFDFASLSGGGGVIRNGHASNPATLTVGGSGTTLFSGIFADSGFATLSLVKTGSGTLVLDNHSIHSGTTTVSAGTLRLSGGSLGNSATTIASGATLAGQGSIQGSVNIQSGGFIAPGINGSGELTTGDITLAGTYRCDLDGGASDRIELIGDLNLTGATIAFNTISPPTAPVYVIASYPGGLIGTPAAVTGIPAGYVLDTATIGEVRLVNSGYAVWAAAKGLDGTPGKENGVNDDPDKDSIENVLEFYLDGNPLASSQSIMPAQSVDASYLILSFKRRDDAEPDVNGQSIGYTSDFIDLFARQLPAGSVSDPNGIVITVVENGAAPDDVTVKLPRNLAPGGRLFARLRVVR